MWTCRQARGGAARGRRGGSGGKGVSGGLAGCSGARRQRGRSAHDFSRQADRQAGRQAGRPFLGACVLLCSLLAGPPCAGDEHEEPEDEEAPAVVKAHRPVGDEGPQRGVQQRVGQAEDKGGDGEAPALQGGGGGQAGGEGAGGQQWWSSRQRCEGLEAKRHRRAGCSRPPPLPGAHRVEAHLALLPEDGQPLDDEVHFHGSTCGQAARQGKAAQVSSPPGHTRGRRRCRRTRAHTRQAMLACLFRLFFEPMSMKIKLKKVAPIMMFPATRRGGGGGGEATASNGSTGAQGVCAAQGLRLQASWLALGTFLRD